MKVGIRRQIKPGQAYPYALRWFGLKPAGLIPPKPLPLPAKMLVRILANCRFQPGDPGMPELKKRIHHQMNWCNLQTWANKPQQMR